MQTVTRNVSDISPSDLPALEHLIGAPLQPSQKVIVQVIDIESSSENSSVDDSELPDWCNVYEGLTDEEIDRLEEGMPRLDLTRDSLGS